MKAEVEAEMRRLGEFFDNGVLVAVELYEKNSDDNVFLNRIKAMINLKYMFKEGFEGLEKVEKKESKENGSKK